MADRLLSLLEPTITGLGYELLGMERTRSSGAQLLRLFIDNPGGITVDDCARVSHQVSALIDAEQAIRGAYTLEVSSPGIDRPLFTLEQHRRYIGAQIAVRLRALLDGRRRVQGELIDVTPDSLIMQVESERLTIPYREVERSKLMPDWAVESKRGRGPATD